MPYYLISGGGAVVRHIHHQRGRRRRCRSAAPLVPAWSLGCGQGHGGPKHSADIVDVDAGHKGAVVRAPGPSHIASAGE